MKSYRIAFLASGNGSTFQYIAERLKADETPAEPVLLVSSSKRAAALQRAASLGIQALTLRERDYESSDHFADALLSELEAKEIDLVCLAGYMKLVPEKVVKAFTHRMLNVHPALLPAFGGKGMYGNHVHKAVLKAGVKISGATIHLVDEVYDRGPIVSQVAVHVQQDDTPETLAARVHVREMLLYYNTVRMFAANRVRIDSNRITILPPPHS